MKTEILKYFYRPQRSWGKVMFLHVSVILFMGGDGWVVVSQHALQFVSQHALQQVSRVGGWYPSITCRFPGPHPGGKLRGLARGVSRPTPRGSPSPHLGVSRPTPGVVSRPTPREVCIPTCTEADPPTATAADGMHPTGMHSCFVYVGYQRIEICLFYTIGN